MTKEENKLLTDLTHPEIKSGNELIAAFLGWWEEPDQKGSWYEKDESAITIAYSVYNNYPHRDLPFHRDWNWLMKAVRKIEELHLRVEIETDSVSIQLRGVEDDKLPFMNTFMHIGADFDENEADAKIQTTWRMVVKFINWYNTQTK